MNPTPAVNTLRPSACPGLLRIVQALDGGICRVKLAGGAITAAQAHAVADAAQAYAGGVIEATNRANLQIRGIGAEPGIYFLGQPYQTRRGSAFIWGVWHDAKLVADHIAIQRSYLAYDGPGTPAL